MNNIILIGMSGAGKSTLGVLLAKALNKNFMDTDLILQQHHQKLLHIIIEEEGILNFKRYEEDMLINLNVNETIIATGGSVVYSKKGMNKLKKQGLVVYIHVSFESIEQRLKDITSRGIVIEENQTLLSLYEQREPLYRTYADIIVDVKEESIEETLNNIIYMINKGE